MRIRLVPATASLLGVALSCVPASPARVDPAPRQAAWVQETLYFGRNIRGAARPDSAVVSDEQWDRFVAATLIPELGGFTVTDAQGTYSDDRFGIVREPTKVVVYAHPDTGVSGVDRATARYKELFRQQSVGRVVAPVLRAEF
ncbi:MAG TPA: DUF3574 domain-containing protein [Gemmatimonadaceae bacterium]|nr:DUF3574 domain-containing protein [Gemmatimonadaceae bacterium]